MAFGRAVITFCGFNLLYLGVAPHPHTILKRMGPREHFDGNFASVGAKKPPSFSFCFPSNMFGVNSVSFTLICVFLTSGCSSVSAQSSDENHYDNYRGNYGSQGNPSIQLLGYI